MPDIMYTPTKDLIQAVRIVPPTTVRTIGGNPVRAVRIVGEPAGDVYTALGFPVQSVRTVDAAGLYTSSLTPITTQPEDVWTSDGQPIEHVRIIDNANGPELARTTDGFPIDAVRLVDDQGAAVSGGNLYDFRLGILPAGVTFTRSSNAWGFNSAGVLTQYATDQPRFVYDPVTLVPLGLLVEGARTNGIRNSMAAGAAAGSPGTVPTNWTVGTSANALTREIIGTGTEDGIEYFDVRLSGTPSASAVFVISSDSATNPGAAAVSAQIWTASAFVRIAAGSTANTSNFLTYILERDAAGAALANSSVAFSVTGAALRTQRILHTRTLNNASTAFVLQQFAFNYTLGNAIDITLRIGLPQLELGPSVSSPIKTSTAAVLRNNDVALITTGRALTDPVWIAKARTQVAGYSDVANAQRLIMRDAGVAADSAQIQRSTFTGGVTLRVVTSNVAQANSTIGAGLTANSDFAAATRVNTNDFTGSINGAAVVVDSAGALPAAPTTFRIGGSLLAGEYWNSTIRSIETRTTASNAELVTLSANV